ncbi:PAS domain S-box protein [Sorangium sp. So ce834]|uniref:PAS domain-containing hybrid sensor histidine kinase/response regulator n=1 Tax=Sorangium sp. So ce834 TaxID=3133321 RepID=UPI003F6488F3
MSAAASTPGQDDEVGRVDLQFRLLAEMLPQMVWSARGDGTWDYVNEPWRTYTALTAEQLMRAGFAAAVHPEDAARCAAAWRAAVARGAPFAEELRLRRHDGAYRWFLARAEPVKDGAGRVIRWLGTSADIDERRRAELVEGMDRRRLVLETARDVTARRNAEESLRESMARFRNIADHAPVVIWVTDPDGSCIYANPRWRELTGQPEATSLGFGWLAAVHPSDHATAAETFRRSTARREAFRMDYRLRRSDGAYRWCIDAAHPWIGPDGELLGYVGSVVDITERKEAELLLRESEERFRRAVMATPFPIMIHADDGEVISLNRAWTEMSGYTRDQIPTLAAWIERAYGAQRGDVSDLIQSLYDADGGTAERELPITTASGEQRIWAFSAAPLGKDAAGRRLAISIAHDVTERRQIDEALRESEARFRQLADAMPQIVWTAKPDGSIDYYNRRWFELAGAAQAEVAGDTWISFLPEDDRQRVLDTWSRSVATGAPYEIEHRIAFPAAREPRWYLVRAVPIRGASDEIARWYGTCTDIHDTKLAEAALKEADQRKDDFLAMLAHELRNPLGPIRNAVELLRHTAVQQPALVRACGVIDRQVAHMARLVDDLLDVSRVARGRIQLRKERCDLVRLLRQTAEDYRSTLEASGLRFDLKLPSGPVWVLGDPTRLSQAVSNLLHNANKFTDPGGRVTVALSVTPESSAVVRVRDTGIGVDPATLARMFEPFTQADRSLDRSRGGLGLGLALVKGLVGLHGGTISAESGGIGHGTEMVLCLPIERSPAPPSERSAPPSRGAEHALRILIIEDNVDAAETLQALLALYGYHVEVALSGPAGVTAARSFRPEVILCDIGLPGGMDGYGVARALRGNVDLSSPSLMIALTGYGQEEDQRRVREAGFDMHFIKPIDLSSLQRILASLASSPA